MELPFGTSLIISYPPDDDVLFWILENQTIDIKGRFRTLWDTSLAPPFTGEVPPPPTPS